MTPIHSDIRPATPDDVPAMARIVHDWELSTGQIPVTPPRAELERIIAEALPDRHMLVSGDPVTGYASLDPSTGFIGALYTDTPGKGAGKRMLDLLKQGRDHLWLTVYRFNTAAIRFYTREGFTRSDSLPGRPGTPEMDRMDWHRAPTGTEAPA